MVSSAVPFPETLPAATNGSTMNLSLIRHVILRWNCQPASAT